MIFVFMLVLQVSGSLLLLLNNLRVSKKAVVKNCFPGSNFVERDDCNNCSIPKKKLQRSAHKIYLNIISFADLAFGYFLAAFSPLTTMSLSCTVWSVVGLTIGLVCAEFFLSLLLAKVIYRKDVQIQYGDLETEDVDTACTSSDINNLFK